jgi:hypothetical protein
MVTFIRGAALLLLLFPPVLLAQQTRIRNDLFGPARPFMAQADTGLKSVLPASPASEKKKVGLAAVYSLLLPGMGELYAGSFSSGRFFLGAEAALWLTFSTFEVYGNSLRDDSRAYAVQHAGISVAGRTDQYFVDIGNFLNTNDFNNKKLRDRDASLVYDASYAWQWDSDASRAAFKGQRIASDNAYNNTKFVVAAIIINHVASAINAARVAIAYNKALQGALGDVQFGAGVMGGWQHPHGIVVTMVKGF